MGIILILAVATVIFILLAFIFSNKDHDGLTFVSGALAGLAGVVCFILLIALIGTAISAPKELPALQAQAAEYQALVDLHSEDTDFDALYANIVCFNKMVREKCNKSESPWLTGLCSPLWHEVPLVELPTK